MDASWSDGCRLYWRNDGGKYYIVRVLKTSVKGTASLGVAILPSSTIATVLTRHHWSRNNIGNSAEHRQRTNRKRSKIRRQPLPEQEGILSLMYYFYSVSHMLHRNSCIECIWDYLLVSNDFNRQTIIMRNLKTDLPSLRVHSHYHIIVLRTPLKL